MKRILGTETEFGIASKNSESIDPVSNSIFLINSYPYLPSSSAFWDYENENPLLDARGFEADGERERPGPEYNRLLNKLLPNGGRLYVDGAHPEYSTPECTNARDLVAFEKAGERILETCLEMASRLKPGESRFSIYKNNTDSKGNSYGYHENYLVSREVPFEKIVAQLTPFLVTRQVFAGAGKVGSENKTESAAYQISQRADFFEVWVDLNTMVKRPIINTRDEPHADTARFRRLHVIVGDANMSEFTTYLKVGTAALVLAMIEEGREVQGVELENPVRSIKEISRDLTLKKKMKLLRGEEWSAIEIQRAYLEQAEVHFAKSDDPVTHDLLEKWRMVLDKLQEDPMQLSRHIDWVIKKELIESYMQRKGCDWRDPRVSMMDLQYHDVTQGKGLYYALERGNYVERIVSENTISDAQNNPPEDTRAYFRGSCLKKFPKEVYAASWSSILFDIGNSSIKRVPLMDPLKGSRALVGPLLDGARTIEELLAIIAT
ncbi:MAG: proteasome accessory factor PafA2 [Candidatus Manganitrophus sp. SB1]|nr:proteasome accessory factor PafA2 [Candidatus Manganitrophus morganii]